MHSLHSKSLFEWDHESDLTMPAMYHTSAKEILIPLRVAYPCIGPTTPVVMGPPENWQPCTRLELLPETQHCVLGPGEWFQKADVEELLGEALGSTPKYHPIFNATTFADRPLDSCDRCAAYTLDSSNNATPGGPHPGEDVYLPTLWKAGQIVLEKLQELHPEARLVVNDAAYIIARGQAQAKHRDLTLAAATKVKVKWSVFVPLTECPQDGTHGCWVARSEDGIPFPWVEVPWPTTPGSVTVISSRCIHNGGGLPKTAAAGEARVVAFFSITSGALDYNVNEHIVLPPWAARRGAAELCAVPGCNRLLPGDLRLAGKCGLCNGQASCSSFLTSRLVPTRCVPGTTALVSFVGSARRVPSSQPRWSMSSSA